MHTEIAPGVLQIDTLLGGWERVTAGYLVTGDAPVLVETGSQTLGAGPARRARRPRRRPPTTSPASPSPTSTSTTPAASATSPRPSRTPPCTCTRGAPATSSTRRSSSNSAAMVYGDLLDSLYGRLDPHRGRAGSTCSRTARRSSVSAEPHAHHRRLARATPSTTSPCTTPTSGLLFAGDAVGVRLPDAGVLRPATPPPDFDLDQALTSLRQVRRAPARRASPWPTSAWCPTRWRSSTRPRRRSRRWAEVAEAAWREGDDIAAALDAALRRRPRRRRPGPAREARDAQRHPLERGRLPALARAGPPRPSPSAPWSRPRRSGW